jgi:hypothetical protein
MFFSILYRQKAITREEKKEVVNKKKTEKQEKRARFLT